MPLRIGLFQFELSHPQNAPHVGSCLFVPDLRADGHRLDACLVGAAHVPDLIRHIEAERYDLVGLDSIFPAAVVDALKGTFPLLPVVVGGVNALALFLASSADLAIVGPGRAAIRALAAVLEAGGADFGPSGGFVSGVDFAAVPNLFFRRGGVIDHSGTTRPWDLRAELLPYEPFLDWGYLGTGRVPGANHRLLSVVAELGCPYMQEALDLGEFAGVEAGEAPAPLLPGLELSERARAAIAPFIANTRGCSFCVFRFQTYTSRDPGETVELTLHQMRHLHGATGAREFSVQSENPFRFMRPLLTRLQSEGPPVDRLAFRTFALALLAKEEEFRRALDLARAAGIQIVLQQIGFESFDQRHLDIYNKGVTVEQNIRAAELLAELKRDYGETIEPFSGHGLILFDPWTTVEDLDRNVRAIERHAPFLLSAVGLNAKLVFYDPFNPIYRKARNEGLVVRSPLDYGWDFHFADPRTADFVQMVIALERRLGRRAGDRSGEAVSSRGYRSLENALFRRALSSYLAHDGDPDGQRAGFVEIARWVDAEGARLAATPSGS